MLSRSTHPVDVAPAALPHGRLHVLIDVAQGVEHGGNEVHDDGDLTDGPQAARDVRQDAQLPEDVLRQANRDATQGMVGLLEVT